MFTVHIARQRRRRRNNGKRLSEIIITCWVRNVVYERFKYFLTGDRWVKQTFSQRRLPFGRCLTVDWFSSSPKSELTRTSWLFSLSRDYRLNYENKFIRENNNNDNSKNCRYAVPPPHTVWSSTSRGCVHGAVVRGLLRWTEEIQLNRRMGLYCGIFDRYRRVWRKKTTRNK